MNTYRGRVYAAKEALRAHAVAKGDQEENLIDLLTDLIHYAHVKHIPWDASLDMAEDHFCHEKYQRLAT